MEGIAIALQRKAEGKCVFCGKKEHENPKKDEIKPTEWKREAISGVGGNFAAQKTAIYPGNISPPLAYRSEGHHCLAFSSFIVDARTARKDRFAALNHYLEKKITIQTMTITPLICQEERQKAIPTNMPISKSLKKQCSQESLCNFISVAIKRNS